MADTKISALAAASTPLAGTEVLPIVQSGATVKVANNDLRPKQIQSNVTSGVMQIAGPANSTTRVMTTPDANFTVARTDGTQTFTAAQTIEGTLQIFTVGSSAKKLYFYPDSSGEAITTQTLQGGAGVYFNDTLDSVHLNTGGTFRLSANTAGNVTVETGNLIIGTSGKGIDFSATAGTGTSELLADYEEGTFTPTVSGSTTAGTGTYTARNGLYTKIGNTVYFQIDYILSAHTGTGDTLISGLPFTSGASYYSNIVATAQNLSLTALYYIGGSIIANADTKIYFQQMPVGGGSAIGIPIDPVCDVRLSGFYFV